MAPPAYKTHTHTESAFSLSLSVTHTYTHTHPFTPIGYSKNLFVLCLNYACKLQAKAVVIENENS